MKLKLSILILLSLATLLVKCQSFDDDRRDDDRDDSEETDYVKLHRFNEVKRVSYVIRDEYGSFEVVDVPFSYHRREPFDNWVAKSIWYPDNFNKTGWALLEIETNPTEPDQNQAFAAGLLEGSNTQEFISLHMLNTVGDFCAKESAQCSKIINFLKENFKWTKDMIEQHADSDPYWHHVGLVFAQFNGLYFGYYNITPEYYETRRPILDSMVDDIKPYLNLLALQLNGDMGELLASLSGVSNPFAAGSCSALIKLLPNAQDLFVSHNTWTVYESMLRIMKHYKFFYHFSRKDKRVIPGREMSFTSYPGILSSIDDYYVIKNGLVVLETTIGNSNADLWKFVTPQTNLYWVRNMISNRLANTGIEWAKYFSLFNSGTYNNEWMIVDYKQFRANETLRENLLVVLEQIPGQVVWRDQTSVLQKQSYWPSYNLAFYPEIYNISGTYDAYVKYGSFFSYDNSPRASIFRRDHSKVVDMPSMINLMRYNNFTLDPLSKCDCDPPYSGENTIAARSDLNPANGKYPFDALGHRDHGATDMKVTNYELASNAQFIGISGPTYGYPNITPFIWSEADFGNSTNHFGHPDQFAFEPIIVKWKFN